MTFEHITKNFQNLNTEEKSEKIIKFSEEIINTEDFKKLINILSEDMFLDTNEIIFFLKKKILENFNYTNNSFNKKILKKNILRSLLFFIILLLAKIFIKKKIKIPKKTYLLLDLIGSNHELSFYKKIVDKYGYDKVFLFKDDNFNLKNQYLKFAKPNKILNSIIPLNKIVKYISLTYKIYIFSKKLDFNLFYFFIKLIFDNYFYNYVFSHTNIKASLIHKHYSTNNIKHFYLRKNKIKSYAIQKNINTTISNGYYYDIDCMLSLSENCKIENFNTYSKIREHKILGSFFMQSFFEETKKIEQNLSFDILYLGGNGLKPKLYYDSYIEYSSDYIFQLEWLKKFSIDFPNLKIGFKHHSNNNDIFEEKIFKFSNVFIINKKINSYHLIDKSKFICSWASTMVVEAISMNKFAFFLNPGLRNKQFLSRIKNFELISVFNYDDFLKKFKYANDKNFIRDENNDSFCKFNKNISDDIFKALNE